MQIKTYNGQTIEVDITTTDNNDSWLALPALIDPHVHFRTPGAEYKENWESGAVAAIAGGVTTVFDMPNNTPSIIDESKLDAKIDLVNKQLKNADIPLRSYFYLGATLDNLAEIEKCKDKIIGVKIFMGASTGNLLVSKSEAQEKIFKKCAELGLVVAVHAEDDDLINEQKLKFSTPTVFDHGKIRPNIAAQSAVTKAIDLARKTGAKLYILHASTALELAIIKQAKQEGLTVYAETTPHHLFLDESAYETLGTLAQMNPPLRSKDDVVALWQAIEDGTIDTIGTDHAPHTLEEKNLPYPQSPSGVPGIETNLPLLLNAYNNGKISLEKIVEITRLNAQKIFSLPVNNDWVIIDLKKVKNIQNNNLKTKCGWSPFDGWKIIGWPIYTILNNKLYKI